MRHRRLTIGGVVLLVGLLAVPAVGLDVALTARSAGAATFTVPAFVPLPDANGYDTGYVVSNAITLTATGNWCTNNVPTDCNGPDGNSEWVMAPNFLYQVPGTAFALVGRIGTGGPWTLIGSGPTTLSGSGEMYLAMNDVPGYFNDNNGTLQVSFAALHVPGAVPPVSSSVTVGEDAVWTVPIVNDADTALTDVVASLHAKANGSTPLRFRDALMPGCSPSEGNVELCNVPDIPAHSTEQLVVYVRTTGLNNGTTVTGDVDVSANGENDASGTLSTVAIASCGAGCVTAVGAPGAPVSSASGAPTDTHPTKQVVVLPTNQPSAPPVAITLKSIDPGPTNSAPDKVLCPPVGIKCSGQISVIAGNFKKYVNKAHPVQVQIIAKWTTNVPAGRLLLLKPTGPPIQLATCVVKKGLYNTPCAKPEVVKGSAAAHNLTTTNTILFVGADPHIARRASNVPDAPTAIKATAAKKSAILQWKAPAVTNGLITGYLVTPRIGKAAQRLVTFTGTGTKRTVTGLVTGKTYTFTVAAKNTHGISYQSIASNAVKVK